MPSNSEFHIGDKVICPRIGKNAVVTAVGIGSAYVEVEADELLPYVNRDNPRRRIWAHRSWVRNEEAQ